MQHKMSEESLLSKNVTDCLKEVWYRHQLSQHYTGNRLFITRMNDDTETAQILFSFLKVVRIGHLFTLNEKEKLNAVWPAGVRIIEFAVPPKPNHKMVVTVSDLNKALEKIAENNRKESEKRDKQLEEFHRRLIETLMRTNAEMMDRVMGVFAQTLENSIAMKEGKQGPESTVQNMTPSEDQQLKDTEHPMPDEVIPELSAEQTRNTPTTTAKPRIKSIVCISPQNQNEAEDLEVKIRQALRNAEQWQRYVDMGNHDQYGGMMNKEDYFNLNFDPVEPSQPSTSAGMGIPQPKLYENVNPYKSERKPQPTHRGGARTKCFECGQFGHVGKDCPNPGKTYCYSCNKIGNHYAKNCPESSAKGPAYKRMKLNDGESKCLYQRRGEKFGTDPKGAAYRAEKEQQEEKEKDEDDEESWD